MFKSLFKDTLVYGVGDFFFKLINFVTFPIYAQIFSVSDYGILSLVTTSMAILAIFFNCGLGSAVHRFYWDPSVAEKERSSLVSSGLASLVFFCLSTSIIAAYLIYQERDLLWEKFHLDWKLLYLGMIGTLFLQIFQYCLDVLRLYFTPWKFTSLSVSQNALLIFLTLFCICWFDLGLKGFFIGTLIANVLLVPFALWTIKKDLTLKIQWKFIKEMVTFGYPLIFGGIAYWIFGSIDRWMLSDLSDSTQVGLYSIAFKLSTVIILICSTFAQAWGPHAMKAYATDPQYKIMLSRLFSFWFYMLMFVAACIGLFSQEVLILLTPQVYWGAAKITLYIALGLALYGTTQMTVITITLAKKNYLITIASWATAVLNFVLNYLFIPSMGGEGAALATLISYGFLTIFYLICSRLIDPIPLEVSKLSLGFLMMIILLSYQWWQKEWTGSWNNALILIKTGIVMLFLLIGFYGRILEMSLIETFFKNIKRKFSSDVTTENLYI
jgi:O-antigen/teichoic acid export membrane protein